MSKIILLGLCCSLMSLWSCTTDREPCLQPRQVNTQIIFKHYLTDTTLSDTSLPAVNFVAIDGDSLKFLLYQSAGVNGVTVPLDNEANTTQFIIQPDTALAIWDTLTLFYDRQLHFISNACGYNFYYNIKNSQTTQYAADTVIINQPQVTNDVSKAHIYLVY